MAGELPFEGPLVELRAKIDELKKFGADKQIDFTEEISRLEERYAQIADDLYRNLTAPQIMQIARHQARPTTLDFIQAITTDFLEQHGDRMFGDDLAIVGGIGRLNGLPVTLVGHQRGKDTKENLARNFGMPHPEGFRKAMRIMKQAEKFRRPVITFIDTKGAAPDGDAEERGQSEAIARNLLEMSVLKVPVVCVVIGEGGSGGALALGVGNRVLMLENAIYSVASPNAAASILWKDASKADQAAEWMKITAGNMLSLDIIDDIIPEPRGGAHRDPVVQAQSIKEAVWKHLQELLTMDEQSLLDNRYSKFRKMGRFTSVKAEELYS